MLAAALSPMYQSSGVDAASTVALRNAVHARALLRNAMTVDVDDYFQVSAFEAQVSRDNWNDFESRVTDLDTALRKQSQTIVNQTLEKLKSMLHKTVAIDGQCVPGSPRTVILDEAETWGADLIVVGSHGYRAWERFLLGSVSQSVVSHAKCSVEVVRCPEAVKISKA